jgi:NADPH:quinone reductase-like Zn-dependent oxidoreductase
LQRYEIHFRDGHHPLQRADFQPPPVGDRQVAVAIKAVSLNYRDLLAAQNTYFAPIPDGRVPCSDGAGEIVAVGKEVTGLKVGDRVATLFFPAWQSGPANAEALSGALGAESDGALTERFVCDASGVIRIPDAISFDEAATLPCAALTAWNALFEAGQLKPGQTVLLQGTGGVSLFGLQFAKAAGARVIITSSSDEKLERARALGADHSINYRRTPGWEGEVLRATGGRGADVVLEVGGPGTLEKSLMSVAVGGRIAYIGVLTGLAGQANPVMLIPKTATINGIFVGSRSMFANMLAAIDRHGIKPVIDRRFGFIDAPAALDHLRSGTHFGKIVIGVGQ